jgi:hypothetical protein
MSVKTKPPAGSIATSSLVWASPAGTMAERLLRIEAMGRRITTYVEYMCKLGDMGGGASLEAKERCVAAFYERLVIAENQLSRIYEGLRLE